MNHCARVMYTYTILGIKGAPSTNLQNNTHYFKPARFGSENVCLGQNRSAGPDLRPKVSAALSMFSWKCGASMFAIEEFLVNFVIISSVLAP